MAAGFAQLPVDTGYYIRIGLHRTDDDRTWRWYDGTSTNFTNWASGQPTGDEGNFATLRNSDGEWYTNAFPSQMISDVGICQKSSC